MRVRWGVGALKENNAGLGVERKRSEVWGCIEGKVCGGERGKGWGEGGVIECFIQTYCLLFTSPHTLRKVE